MPLLINGIILLIFGLLAVYSTSVYESFTMSLSSINKGFTTFSEPTNYYYFYQQLKALVYIVIAIVVLRKFPVKALKNHKFAGIIIIFSFIFQCLVFTKWGDSYNGARGWLNIPHVPSIQPSEFFKLGYVIFLASWLSRKKEKDSLQFMLSFIVLSAILYTIFCFIPDFGTVLIIGATALIMVRYSGLSLKKTLAILGIGALAGGVAIITLGSIPKLKHVTNRVVYFFTSDKEKIQAEREKIGWQTTQALIAIGGGGFFGNGYGRGLQKYSNLPESYCDFIFAAFSEEIGFVGNMFLIALYIRMFWYVLKHIQKINDPQLKLIGIGIISLIIVQTLVNIGVNIQIIPTTGVTLPFVSAGGSALMVNCIELLLLYKILKTENKVLPVK